MKSRKTLISLKRHSQQMKNYAPFVACQGHSPGQCSAWHSSNYASDFHTQEPWLFLSISYNDLSRRDPRQEPYMTTQCRGH